MSIESKVDFLNSIETRLSVILTARDMDAAMRIIRDELGDYAVEAITKENNMNTDLLNAYLAAKNIEGRSTKTIDRYRYILSKAIREMGVSERRITVYHLRGWLMNERKRGLSDSTLEGYRAIFSGYFSWLHREGLISVDPCTNLGTIKCPKVVRLPFSDIEIERMKEACGDIRDKAIICFLLSTGCRISEVVALNREDIDYQAMQCTVTGKGNKQRVAYIDNVTRMHLRRYEATRMDDSSALFAGKGTDRITPSGIRRMLKHIGKKSGIENIHPHRFRRTLATNLIARGMPIQEVSRILGHERLDTTMTYVYLNDRDIQVNYRKYS